MADKCPKCGANLQYDEVGVGQSGPVIRSRVMCPECLWSDDIVEETSRCPNGVLGLHNFKLNDGTQCAFCLKFKAEPEESDGINYGNSH